MRAEAALVPEQRLRVVCECGVDGSAVLAHYGKVLCKCGRRYWALQPRRGGPLVLFPWPGLPAGHREVWI